MRVVDIHPHIISADVERYPRSPLGGKQSVWATERPIDCDQLLRAMDEAGVDRAAVVQASTAYGYDNSYLADCLRLHADRLAGVGTADFLAADAIDQMKYWIDERGLVGVRLFTRGSTMPEQSTWLDDPRTHPAWGFVEERGIPVCVQMSVSGIPMLEHVLARFPNLIVILDHACNPNLDDGPPYRELQPVLPLSRHPRIHVKLSTHSLLEATEGRATPTSLVHALVGAFGAGRLAWGSNYPASPGTLSDHLARARAAVADLSEDDAARVLGGTALRLYPGLQAGQAAKEA